MSSEKPFDLLEVSVMFPEFKGEKPDAKDAVFFGHNNFEFTEGDYIISASVNPCDIPTALLHDKSALDAIHKSYLAPIVNEIRSDVQSAEGLFEEIRKNFAGSRYSSRNIFSYEVKFSEDGSKTYLVHDNSDRDLLSKLKKLREYDIYFVHPEHHNAYLLAGSISMVEANEHVSPRVVGEDLISAARDIIRVYRLSGEIDAIPLKAF